MTQWWRPLALALALLAAGCAQWTRVDSPAAMAGPGDAYFIDPPVGWVRLELYTGGIRMTRDGFPVQMLDIELAPHDRVLPRTKKKTAANMPAQELAEALLAEMRAGGSLASLTVQQNAPARVGGQNGFRVQAQFRNERGVLYGLVIYGAALPEGRLMLVYRAIDRHFFARDLPVFEDVVRSWRSRRST